MRLKRTQIAQVEISRQRDPWSSWQSVWRLSGALAKQRVANKFAGSWMGYLWSLAYPMVLVIVYATVFSVIVPSKPGDQNYAAFICSGLFFWLFLSESISESTTSLLEAKPMISQSFFPRWVIPCAVSLSNLFLFLCTIPVLTIVLLFLGQRLHSGLLLLPIVLAVAWLLTFGAALILAPLSVIYRDTQHVVSLVLTPAFFLSPVLYPSERMADVPWLSLLVRLNPATPFLDLMRHCFLENRPDAPWLLVQASLYAVTLVTVGFWLFRRLEKQVAVRL